jgi:hypothetical protein
MFACMQAWPAPNNAMEQEDRTLSFRSSLITHQSPAQVPVYYNYYATPVYYYDTSVCTTCRCLVR